MTIDPLSDAAIADKVVALCEANKASLVRGNGLTSWAIKLAWSWLMSALRARIVPWALDWLAVEAVKVTLAMLAAWITGRADAPSPEVRAMAGPRPKMAPAARWKLLPNGAFVGVVTATDGTDHVDFSGPHAYALAERFAADRNLGWPT